MIAMRSSFFIDCGYYVPLSSPLYLEELHHEFTTFCIACFATCFVIMREFCVPFFLGGGGGLWLYCLLLWSWVGHMHIWMGENKK